MRRINITYAMYFNQKYNHSGNIFQGKYKNVPVTNENHLLYLTKYIHLNPEGLFKGGKNLSKFKHSSYAQYLGNEKYGWIKPKSILSYFTENMPDIKYKNFVESNKYLSETALKLMIDS